MKRKEDNIFKFLFDHLRFDLFKFTFVWSFDELVTSRFSTFAYEYSSFVLYSYRR